MVRGFQVISSLFYIQLSRTLVKLKIWLEISISQYSSCPTLPGFFYYHHAKASRISPGYFVSESAKETKESSEYRVLIYFLWLLLHNWKYLRACAWVVSGLSAIFQLGQTERGQSPTDSPWRLRRVTLATKKKKGCVEGNGEWTDARNC